MSVRRRVRDAVAGYVLADLEGDELLTKEVREGLDYEKKEGEDLKAALREIVEELTRG